MTNMLTIENSYTTSAKLLTTVNAMFTPCSTRCDAMSCLNVSTPYLGTALLLPVRQAQSAARELDAEATTGQYADLGLQLGDQSGYELSLRKQTDLLQTLTAANNLTVANLETAQAALTSIRTDAAERGRRRLTSLTRRFGAAASTCRPPGATRCRS